MTTKSNIIVACAIIAVGLVSFISGRISLGEKGSVKDLSINPIQNSPSAPANAAGEKNSGPTAAGTSSDSSDNGEYSFVASKNGQKYFPIACGSAKTIKKENAIYFKSMEEAEFSGRTQSTQCKY